MTLLIGMALFVAPAQAHKLKVFAFADGARIGGSVYFAGGGPAAGVVVRIRDRSGGLLAELTSAADGSFRYTARAPVEHRVVAESADGHRAEWRVGAAELAGGFPGSAPAGGRTADAAAPAAVEPSPDGLDPLTRAAIERALSRQLAPLRAELLAQRDALRLRDILGGLGYIFGIAGLALWWHSRRGGGSP
jgi:nickel transport protein